MPCHAMPFFEAKKVWASSGSSYQHHSHLLLPRFFFFFFSSSRIFYREKDIKSSPLQSLKSQSWQVSKRSRYCCTHVSEKDSQVNFTWFFCSCHSSLRNECCSEWKKLMQYTLRWETTHEEWQQAFDNSSQQANWLVSHLQQNKSW